MSSFFQDGSGAIVEDLEWDYEDLPSSLDWTFNAFLDEYNKLYAFLNKMQQLKFLSPAIKATFGGNNSSQNDFPHKDESIINNGQLYVLNTAF